MPVFSSIPQAHDDPILGLNEVFKADERSFKVNLGVGVYYTNDGKVPVLAAIRKAEEALFQRAEPRLYIPIGGLPNYVDHVKKLVFGVGNELYQSERIATVQTLGGTGALSIGARLLHMIAPNAKVAVSNPTWDNHRAIFAEVGFPIVDYPYYDSATLDVDFSAMLQGIQALPAKSIVLLHACCHNPTGIDLSLEQWKQVRDVLLEREHIAFMDLAYQGFGDNLNEDAQSVRLLAESGLTVLVANSFSKNCSLYGERVGALSVVLPNADESERVRSQMWRLVRAIYSNPPTIGAALVNEVLSSSELTLMWHEELQTMCDRIKAMRQALQDGLAAQGVKKDLSFITRQRGMFSYTGMSPEQVRRLREQYAIYAIETSRCCIAALNQKNIGYVAECMAKVM